MNQEALIQAMMSKGHSRESAMATIAGRTASAAPDDLKNLYTEYLGGSSGLGTEGYMSDLIGTITGDLVPQALEFDTDAARAAAEQEWNPYFDEIIGDYLSDLGRVSPVRQERIGGEFADRRLYQSGQREEAQRVQLEEEDIQRSRRERDLARQRESAVTGQIETQREEKFLGY